MYSIGYRDELGYGMYEELTIEETESILNILSEKKATEITVTFEKQGKVTIYNKKMEQVDFYEN